MAKVLKWVPDLLQWRRRLRPGAPLAALVSEQTTSWPPENDNGRSWAAVIVSLKLATYDSAAAEPFAASASPHLLRRRDRANQRPRRPPPPPTPANRFRRSERPPGEQMGRLAWSWRQEHLSQRNRSRPPARGAPTSKVSLIYTWRFVSRSAQTRPFKLAKLCLPTPSAASESGRWSLRPPMPLLAPSQPSSGRERH